MERKDYITLRIINACLREDVGGLVSSGRLLRDRGQLWLTFPAEAPRLRLAVVACDYMQPWLVRSPDWERLTEEGWVRDGGYRRWLSAVMPDGDAETQALFTRYAEEADAAVAQGELCDAAFRARAGRLNLGPAEMDWGERLRHADQIASFLDHPYYPTARAKFGFSEEDLRRYAPEFSQPFLLRWLALPKGRLTLTEPDAKPGWWPRPRQVGLDASLENDVDLIPVHPLTLGQLADLPAGSLIAPRPWLEVWPTLSVRTVQLSAHPEQHLKVPLAMRTLGQKNIRLIKPSTLYDGQWFARTLSALEAGDPLLRGRYRHVDEGYCGHVDDSKQLAFLLRRYPQPRRGETLLPAAALGGVRPDGVSYLQALLDQPGLPDIAGWWQAYCELLADVHLTLWLRYGIALESNQQNAVLSIAPGEPLSLVMKDNDAARVLPSRFRAAAPELADGLGALQDARILVEDDAALAKMFITITLQLCLAAVLESLSAARLLDRGEGYRTLRRALERTLQRLEGEGVDAAFAREQLFSAPTQPVKYLLQSGSLLSKQASGAADINKFYGHTGPNFLLRGEA